METLHVGVTGTSVTTGAASKTAIPVAANGVSARRVAIMAVGAAAVYAYVRPTQNANGATTDIPVYTGAPPLILNVQGFTHIGHIEGTTAAVIKIIPLED